MTRGKIGNASFGHDQELKEGEDIIQYNGKKPCGLPINKKKLFLIRS